AVTTFCVTTLSVIVNVDGEVAEPDTAMPPAKPAELPKIVARVNVAVVPWKRWMPPPPLVPDTAFCEIVVSVTDTVEGPKAKIPPPDAALHEVTTTRTSVRF